MRMKRTRNWIVAAIVLVLLGGAVYQHGAAKRNAVPVDGAPKPGFAAPSLQLQSLDGSREWAIGGQRDKPLLLNYWASWCLPCQEELPDLQSLYEQYGDQLDIYGVNATFHDEPELAQKKVQQFGLKFPILTDPDAVGLDLYKVAALPMTFLIDKNGKIVEVLNLVNREELEKRIKKLI